jgi:hypothetical protein
VCDKAFRQAATRWAYRGIPKTLSSGADPGCRYVEPPLDSVVDGIRPFDGKSYCHMIEELKELLQSPDIDDADSGARCRLEELMRAFRPLYALKAGHCCIPSVLLLAVPSGRWPALPAASSAALYCANACHGVRPEN